MPKRKLSKPSPKPGKGELRRRVRSFIEDGSLARLGSEGRLVAHYVFERADWATGEIRFSMRHVARVMKVSPTAIRRGVEQMIREEILEISAKGEGSLRSKYTVVARAHSVSGARTPCDHYSVLFSGIPVNTTGITNTADASDGEGPSEPQPQIQVARGSAAPLAPHDTLTEEESP
jgi:hypothetical protein